MYVYVCMYIYVWGRGGGRGGAHAQIYLFINVCRCMHLCIYIVHKYVPMFPHTGVQAYVGMMCIYTHAAKKLQHVHKDQTEEATNFSFHLYMSR